MVFTVGLATKLTPEPIRVPPQDPVCQYQLAALPNVPPIAVKVVEPPEQIVDGLGVAEVAGIEFVFTITVFVLHKVELHVPSALKKYVVDAEGSVVILTPEPA